MIQPPGPVPLTVDRVLNLALDTLSSAASRRAYRRALLTFLEWRQRSGAARLDRAMVQVYKQHLLQQELAPSSINQTLSAIRTLVREAAHSGYLATDVAASIASIRGVKTAGVRTGNWLTQSDAQRLLDAPDVTTLKGQRDRAILAALLGCGLRRSEVAGLTVGHVQQREGRWIVVDLVGKGRRVRTVPMPSWVKLALDAWMTAGTITAGRIFRAVNKGGVIVGDGLSNQAVADVVRTYARLLGRDVAAHDLRRTFAKLALRGDARIEQISLSLGHASIQTTERYLGVQQDLQDAPCDRLGLRIEAV
jgi:site-specific recombinase XerD